MFLRYHNLTERKGKVVVCSRFRTRILLADAGQNLLRSGATNTDNKGEGADAPILQTQYPSGLRPPGLRLSRLKPKSDTCCTRRIPGSTSGPIYRN